jgi:hypothetical protein
MWVFTRLGYISAVAARKGNGEPWQEIDPDRIAIRTRTRQQLKNLIARFPDDLSGVPIWDDSQADYRYRLFVAKAVWVKIAAELAAEVSYDRFKPAILEFPGKGEYHDRLLDVWNVMLHSQHQEGRN